MPYGRNGEHINWLKPQARNVCIDTALLLTGNIFGYFSLFISSSLPSYLCFIYFPPVLFSLSFSSVPESILHILSAIGRKCSDKLRVTIQNGITWANSRSTVLLEKLIVAQLVTKFSAFYGSRRFITMKISVFWVVAPCSLVEVCQRFRGPCCLHHQGDRRENLKSYRQKINI
jgi:hypothetical protein